MAFQWASTPVQQTHITPTLHPRQKSLQLVAVSLLPGHEEVALGKEGPGHGLGEPSSGAQATGTS